MVPIREQLKYLPVVIAFIVVGIGFNFAPAITLGAIAGVFFVLALLCLIEDHRLARSGRRAQGVVVGHEVEEDCFWLVVEFTDRNGVTRREATRMGRGLKKPPVGSRVVVLYDEQSKLGCEIDKFWRRRGFALALALFGVVFAVGAILAK